ncbi:MAG: T9SS type A sorting domain-containing protein [candidate division Zixibacteria bacterium]|nr:T9SS type A sorting domain-containing protein [candidate division Zixibacteria bacterium]
MCNKSITLNILALLVVGILLSSVFADENQWATNGPSGGSVKTIAIKPFSPHTVYLGTIVNGVYKTIDGGENWHHLDNGGLFSCMRIITFHPFVPDTVYAASVTGIFKSSDDGENWVQFSPPESRDREYRALLIHPTDPNLIFTGGPIIAWMSTDGGQNWLRPDMPQYIGTKYITVDYNNPDNIYWAAGGLGHGLGIWKSDDRGETWNNIQNNIDSSGFGTCIEVDPVDSEILYFSYANYEGNGDCLAKSYNGGQSWIDITPTGLNTPAIKAVKVLPSDRNTIIICTAEDGVLKSSDGGETWRSINNGLKVVQTASMELDTTNGILYLGTYHDGIYKSTDDGETWLKISSNINCVETWDLAVSNFNPDFTIVAARNGIYSSPDCGQTWDYIDIGYPIEHKALTVEFDEYYPDNIYIATGSTTYPPQGASGFYRTLNNGESWEFFNSGLPNDRFYIDIAISSYNEEARRFFLTSDQGLYFSDDFGESWTLYTYDIPVNMWYTVVEVAPTDPNTIAVGDAINRVFISHDRGETWHQADDLPEISEGEFIQDIEFHPSDADHIYVSSYYLGLFESTDSGESWNNINNDMPLPSAPYHFVVSGISINPLNPQNMFISSNNIGVCQSHNGGQNWELFNAGLDSTCGVGEMMFAPGDTTKLYLATAMRSVWSITRTPTGIAVDDNILPLGISLSNYPNPFNARTTISYNLQLPTDVAIDIYDILGRQVETLVNIKQTAGWHQVVWNAESAASGIYFYKLTADGNSDIQKMMLLK